jgi:hypothetical protein
LKDNVSEGVLELQRSQEELSVIKEEEGSVTQSKSPHPLAQKLTAATHPLTQKLTVATAGAVFLAFSAAVAMGK